MKFWRRFLEIPATFSIILLEILYLIGLILWIIGWPYSRRLQNNDNDGLWDDDDVAILYFCIIIVVTLLTMAILPLTALPFWKGYISRWSITALIPLILWLEAWLTNILLGLIRFIPYNCGNDPENGDSSYYVLGTSENAPNYGNGVDHQTQYCRGSKIIVASTIILMATAGFTALYLIWLLQEILFQGARKVHKRAKQRDAKIVTSGAGVVGTETRETITTHNVY
eukprot:TRINITY_DN20026_c0_g1_i1.p1 TRINITY_DN20026_c0_g1~~TRINITY_DN20026_c0_g1_i1.p1  ORF type:complete len:226 (-),score=26.88 TRINITY_DN20026_c0_g1_i1:121-798(-)